MAEAVKDDAKPQPRVVHPSDPRTPAGCCPKCGAHIGNQRQVRAHARSCTGKKPAL